MATQAEESVAAENPQMVANVFVEKYYTMLSHYSETVHKFYRDSSVISRENSDGSMFSVSTMEEMEKLFLDYKRCIVEILTSDAQNSLNDGVIVLVTGFITGKDNIKRKFSQLFFLAKQESGYYVLNDVFRYVDEVKVADLETSDSADSAPNTSVTPEPEPPMASSYSVPEPVASPSEDGNQVAESSLPLENGKVPSAENEPVADSVNNDTQPVSVSTSENDVQAVSNETVSTIQENAQKPTFAALANALNSKSEPFRRRVIPAKVAEQRVAPAPAPASASSPVTRVASRPVTNNGVEKKPNNNTVKGYSIFVANLPMDATVEQLIQVFEKYGPIKPNGVQVRSYKQEKNCFGFVEFESADSMKLALEDSSIVIGNRQAHIEEKKATNDGGKFRKGGFRSDSFKNRGSRGYGRTESEDQTGFTGHARGRGRNAESNQKAQENGRGSQ